MRVFTFVLLGLGAPLALAKSVAEVVRVEHLQSLEVVSVEVATRSAVGVVLA